MSVLRSRSPVVKTIFFTTKPWKLSSDLQWNSHVDKIAKKVNYPLAFVKKNLFACSEETKCAAYVPLVRPHLEYVSAVWDPYRQNRVENLEAIQNSAARFIKRD